MLFVNMLCLRGTGLVFILKSVVRLLIVLVLYKSYETSLRDAGFE